MRNEWEGGTLASLALRIPIVCAGYCILFYLSAAVSSNQRSNLKTVPRLFQALKWPMCVGIISNTTHLQFVHYSITADHGNTLANLSSIGRMSKYWTKKSRQHLEHWKYYEPQFTGNLKFSRFFYFLKTTRFKAVGCLLRGNFLYSCAAVAFQTTVVVL